MSKWNNRGLLLFFTEIPFGSSDHIPLGET